MARPNLNIELLIEDMTIGDLRAFLAFVSHLPDDTHVWLSGDQLDPHGPPLALVIDHVKAATTDSPDA